MRGQANGATGWGDALDSWERLRVSVAALSVAAVMLASVILSQVPRTISDDATRRAVAVTAQGQGIADGQHQMAGIDDQLNDGSADGQTDGMPGRYDGQTGSAGRSMPSGGPATPAGPVAPNPGRPLPVAQTSQPISSYSDISGTTAYAMLSQAISQVEAQGFDVGACLCSMDGTPLVSYRPDVPMYPASSAKGPYVVAVWREGGGSGQWVRSTTEAIVGWSDNEAYVSLWEAYGKSPTARLALEAGIEAGAYGGDVWSWASFRYPLTSAQDLCRLWVAGVSFLDGGTDDATELVALFDGREVSPLRDGLAAMGRTGARTTAKAGWLSEGGGWGSTPAGVDAGLVRCGARRYAVAVMVDEPEGLESVARLAAALDACHAVLSGLSDVTPAAAEAMLTDQIALGGWSG